ncbi:MAG: Carbonic anhydrase, beta class, partial [uncultured Gemmatimonadetes bacterium]
ARAEPPSHAEPRMGAVDDRPRPGLLFAAFEHAVARVPVDRVRRQPRAGQRDRQPASGRAVRSPQRGQRGGAHRPQLPVGAAVRRGRAPGEARHRHRALRVRRRAGRAAEHEARADRQLAAPRAGRARQALGAPGAAGGGRAPGPHVRAERDRAGLQRLPDHHRAGRLGARAGAVGARVDLPPAGRHHPRPEHDRDQRRRAAAGARRGRGGAGRI